VAPLEYLSRNITLRILYTDAVTAKSWRDEVPRKRIKVWTQDAVVMAEWKDPKTLLPGKGPNDQERFFAWENFVSDVQVAHAELLRHNEINPNATAFLGHSEGALLSLAATQAMSQRAPYALVLASAPGLPLRDIVRGQIGRNAPILLAEAERVMAAIVKTGHVPADTQPTTPRQATARPRPHMSADQWS